MCDSAQEVDDRDENITLGSGVMLTPSTVDQLRYVGCKLSCLSAMVDSEKCEYAKDEPQQHHQCQDQPQNRQWQHGTKVVNMTAERPYGQQGGGICLNFRDMNTISYSKVHIGNKYTYGNKYYGVRPQDLPKVTKTVESEPQKMGAAPEPIINALNDNRRVCLEQLQYVARNLFQQTWQQLGLHLSLTNSKLSFIFEDYSEHASCEVPFQMLLHWSRKLHPHDTVAALANGLLKVGLTNVAQDLHKLRPPSA